MLETRLRKEEELDSRSKAAIDVHQHLLLAE